MTDKRYSYFQNGPSMTVKSHDWGQLKSHRGYGHGGCGILVMDATFYGVMLFCLVATAERYWGSGIIFAWVKQLVLAPLGL